MTAKLAIKGNRDAEVSFIVRQRNVNVAMQSKWGLFEAGRSELSGINAPSMTCVAHGVQGRTVPAAFFRNGWKNSGGGFHFCAGRL